MPKLMYNGEEIIGGGSASAGVSSFNGRAGDVMPQEGDYTAKMVGAATMDDVNAAIEAAIPKWFTDGEWIYKKYSDGYVEMIRSVIVGPFVSTDFAPSGAIYAKDGALNASTLPVTLISRLSYMAYAGVESIAYGNGAWCADASSYNPLTTVPKIALYRATQFPSGRELSYRITQIVTGMWK